MNSSYKENSKLNTLLNRCLHKILRFTSYKNSTNKNLMKLNWIRYQQMLIMGAVKLFHKVILENKPTAIVQYISQSMIYILGTRYVRYSTLARASLNSKMAKSLFHRAINIHKGLPLNIKLLEAKKFNDIIKETI